MPKTSEEVRIVPFADRHREAFRDLNLAWIERNFFVEEPDRRQLSDPRGHIIDRGGEVLIAELDDRVVGTCAMMKVDAHCYGLAKMTVADDVRGHGIGDQLLRTAIAWAQERGAAQIKLLSHTSLVPALNLYRKHGFRTIPVGDVNDEYEVCDIAMELELTRS